jgi:hypothetical protein
MLGFICDPCRYTADKVVILKGKAQPGHKSCKGGTWCDCQHRVGRKNTP